jgi:hypothetical protein
MTNLDPKQRLTLALIVLAIATTSQVSGRTLSVATRAEIKRYAVDKKYDERDIPALANAVEVMAQTEATRETSVCTAPLKLIEGHRRYPAALLVNPVCGECDRVIGLFRNLAKKSSNTAPTVFVGEVPSSEDSSREAVTLLRTLSNEPDTRAALLQELLARQPSTIEEVRRVARAYAPALVEQREHGQLKDSNLCDDVPSPLVRYRGRILQRSRANGVTFDPLRNEASVQIALDAVDDLEDADNVGSDRPTICGDSSLAHAVQIIASACSELVCDPAKMRQLDDIDRTSLLTALRNPYLMPVHIFFPPAKTRLTEALDWQSTKEDQLKTITYLNAPDKTFVFVIGTMSGTGDDAGERQLARARTLSVSYYLRDVLHIRCRQVKGGWLPSSVLRLTDADASFLSIARRDYRADSAVLNQSVHVFTYPCGDAVSE